MSKAGQIISRANELTMLIRCINDGVSKAPFEDLCRARTLYTEIITLSRGLEAEPAFAPHWGRFKEALALISEQCARIDAAVKGCN